MGRFIWPILNLNITTKKDQCLYSFENDFGYLYYFDSIDICDHYLFVYLDALYRDGEIYSSMIRSESGIVMVDLNSENVAFDFERKINVIRKPVEEQVKEILKKNK